MIGESERSTAEGSTAGLVLQRARSCPTQGSTKVVDPCGLSTRLIGLLSATRPDAVRSPRIAVVLRSLYRSSHASVFLPSVEQVLSQDGSASVSPG